MKKTLLTLAIAALAASLTGCGGDDGPAPTLPASAPASTPTPTPPASAPATAQSFTLALFGDVPYATNKQLTEFKHMPAYIQSVNADRDVSVAAHVGDLHSGSEPCTAVYDSAIASYFKQFTVPLVYTPGDNEWADCHKAKQMNGQFSETDPLLGYPINAPIPSYQNGNPVDNLALVRNLFFPAPGQTLGSGTLKVHSQATEGKTATDREYVENVWWQQGGVLFVAVNIPGGSNNGTDVWWATGQPATDQQNQEVAKRTAATKAWLQNGFDQAKANGATAMVILTQADMWDGDPAHLTEYRQYTDLIAQGTTAFAKPVLLVNGDSHVYRSDNPFVQGAQCVIEPVDASGNTSGGAAQPCSSDAYASNQPGSSYHVTNFHRVIVHGSTLPMEWLKLKVDPSVNAPASATAFGPFSWTRQIQQ